MVLIPGGNILKITLKKYVYYDLCHILIAIFENNLKNGFIFLYNQKRH